MPLVAATTCLKADVPTRFGCLEKAKKFQLQTGTCANSARSHEVVDRSENSPLFGSQAVSLLILVETVRLVSCAMLPFVKTWTFLCRNWVKSEPTTFDKAAKYKREAIALPQLVVVGRTITFKATTTTTFDKAAKYKREAIALPQLVVVGRTTTFKATTTTTFDKAAKYKREAIALPQLVVVGRTTTFKATTEDKEESRSATITVIIVAILVGEAPDEVPVIATEVVMPVVMPVVEEETLSVSGAINLVTTQMPVQIANRILQ
jgi:hypothetical protein